MNTLKTVFNKLSKEDKVELKSEKIELAAKSIQNLEQSVKKINNLRDGARGVLLDSLRVEKQLKPLLEEKKEHLEYVKDDSFMKKAKQNLKESFNEVSKEASELGVSPMDLPIYKQYKEALEKIKEHDKYIKDITKALK